MKNMKSIMKSDNSAILNKHTSKTPQKHATAGITCPLSRKCLVNAVVYKATASSQGTEPKLYRAVNSHALSVSLMPGHYFSRSHAKHVKSPA